MKCFLLLAAVYSLIIHQWHKENGDQTPGNSIVKTVPKKTEPKKMIAATKKDPQFTVFSSFLKMNK
jgi:hypothetical protein